MNPAEKTILAVGLLVFLTKKKGSRAHSVPQQEDNSQTFETVTALLRFKHDLTWDEDVGAWNLIIIPQFYFFEDHLKYHRESLSDTLKFILPYVKKIHPPSNKTGVYRKRRGKYVRPLEYANTDEFDKPPFGFETYELEVELTVPSNKDLRWVYVNLAKLGKKLESYSQLNDYQRAAYGIELSGESSTRSIFSAMKVTNFKGKSYDWLSPSDVQIAEMVARSIDIDGNFQNNLGFPPGYYQRWIESGFPLEFFGIPSKKVRSR